jgi:hypothetical protein
MTKRMILLSVCFGLVFAGTVGVEARKKKPKLPLQTVTCGFVVNRSIRIANSLWDCPVDGLIVNAPNITIDLNGQTIDGNDTNDDPGTDESGIDNFAGHDDVTIRNGTLSQFEIGYLAGDSSVRNVVAGITAVDCSSGIETTTLIGGGHRITSSTAVGNVAGFRVTGDEVLLRGNVARRNVAIGFHVHGAQNRLLSNTAEDNDGMGFGTSGGTATLTKNVSRWNEEDGFITSSTVHYDRNVAMGNEENGFVVMPDVSDVRFVRNTASRTTGGTGSSPTATACA